VKFSQGNSINAGLRLDRETMTLCERRKSIDAIGGKQVRRKIQGGEEKDSGFCYAHEGVSWSACTGRAQLRNERK